MTKQEKIAVLDKAMTVSKRDDGTTYTHFTKEAPEELKDLFLEHYNVRELDYDVFSEACDVVSEVYADKPNATDDQATEDIYERSSDRASYYNDDRLEYITIWNQDEVADIVREQGCDIATAGAVWYDRAIEQASIIIKDWIIA